MISGDSEAATRFVACLIGADDFRAGALPSDKAAAIAEFQAARSATASMTRPLSAQADLGIAMGSGTDIAMKAADIVLACDSLQKLLTVFDLSKKTWSIVRQTLFWVISTTEWV